MGDKCNLYRNTQVKWCKVVLEANGLPYSFVPGGSHIKVFTGKRLILVLSRGKGHDDKREQLNMRKQIERIAKELQCQK